MAALPNNLVHRGFWIDWRQGGPVLGATITTTASNANLVIAILSLLVSFTGAHLWDLIAFASYCSGVSNQRRSALHYQRQILARNITSPGAFLLEITKVGWAWRRYGAWHSLIILAGLAFLCSAGFLVAGIIVSQIVSVSDVQVLVRSESCGFLSWHNETTNQGREYEEAVFRQALTYSETCYNQTVNLPQCKIYAKQAIPVYDVANTACPFHDFCVNDSALRIDTGLLDSNNVFGINTNGNLRVQMRRVITCAPLNLVQFSTTRPIPADYLRRFDNREPLPGEQLQEWFFGPPTMDSRPFNSTIWQSNYTASASTIYFLTPRAYYPPVDVSITETWHNSTFTPIPELRRDDADTHVIAIQNNGVRFFAPNDDPLFSAHHKTYVLFDDNENITMYTGDHSATFLGCAEQMQFCFATGGCTRLMGVDSAYHEARMIAPSHQQYAILYYLFSLAPTMYWVTRAPLLVTRSTSSFQPGRPSDQWKIETRAWIDFTLAIMQTTVPHLAAGPGIVRSDFDQLAEPLMWPDLCQSQRMGAPDGYSNINVLGLALTVGLSGIIILINLNLVPTLKYLDRHDVLPSQRMKSWIQDGLLQVQRKAYEGAGYSGWMLLDGDVPIIRENPSVPGMGTETFLPLIECQKPNGHITSQPQNPILDSNVVHLVTAASPLPSVAESPAREADSAGQDVQQASLFPLKHQVSAPPTVSSTPDRMNAVHVQASR